MNELSREQPTLLGIPAGKSLEAGTLELLAAAHIGIIRAHPRSCRAKVEGFPGIREAIFIKPSQIPELVADGTIPLALTGEDTVIESGANVETLTTLAYSRATQGGTRCVLFTRDARDVPPLKSTSRVRGARAKVVSEYPKETANYLRAKGIDAKVIPSTGSAESLVVIGKYDYGVALTETGTSLRVNGLREIDEIFTSRTALIGNKKLLECDIVGDRARYLAKLLKGIVEARDKVYITMNAPLENVDAIKGVLPSLKSPTIQPLADSAFCAISSVVPIRGLVELKFKLLALGAEGIVEIDHHSILG